MTESDYRGSLETHAYPIDELVDRVHQGRIRIPSFQRGLRWTLNDAIRLFDSIKRGYPIGNLLLWSRPAKAQRNLTIGAISVDAPDLDQALFVVDGQQRLTSLASALSPASEGNPNFAISFDMAEDRFVAPKHGSPLQVPLYVIFELPQLIRWFSERPELAADPIYFERATRIAKAVREFRVPVYVVQNTDEDVLRDIFDRMNNYGKQLTRAEVFTALHEVTSGDGSRSDPLHQFERMAAAVHAATGFGVVDSDTCLLAMLARRGHDISRDIRKEFESDTAASAAKKRQIEFPLEGSEDAYREATVSMIRAVRFLQNEAEMPHFALLPYRYLLVVLTRFFAHFPDLDPADVRNLRRWFWRAAALGPEFSRGNLHASTRMLGVRIVPGDLQLSIKGLLELVGKYPPRRNLGRFRTNHADSRIILAALWSVHPRRLDLDGRGEPYTLADLLEALGEGGSAVNQAVVISDSSAAPAALRAAAGNRVLLAEKAELAPELAASAFAMLGSLSDGGDQFEAVLESHLMSAEDGVLLAQGGDAEVLARRQQRVEQLMDAFIEQQAEWLYEDTPNLHSLVIDEDGN